MSLSDWYHTEHAPLLAHYISVYNGGGAEPIPDAGLINHKTSDSFAMVPGKTYRFRFVSMTAFAMYTVWMDGHDMRVVEVDGVTVAPATVTAFPLAGAQRVSVLVTAQLYRTAICRL